MMYLLTVQHTLPCTVSNNSWKNYITSVSWFCTTMILLSPHRSKKQKPGRHWIVTNKRMSRIDKVPYSSKFFCQVFCGKCSGKSCVLPKFGIEREVRWSTFCCSVAGSVTFLSGIADPYLLLTDPAPDPPIFVGDLTWFYSDSDWRRGHMQCCGTGTGTVGTVTVCLVEPEPEP